MASDRKSNRSRITLIGRSLGQTHAVGEILGLTDFNENHLYANLDWLADTQSEIEQRLFKTQEKSDGLFLYDVTSSYFEGTQNALAAFGYNRDKKRGKKQIVIGLLCNSTGRPLAIEVFYGNTQDTKTFASQIKKVRAKEIVQSRNDKYASLHKAVDQANGYLKEHPGASSQGQLDKRQELAAKLKIQGWVCLSSTEKDERTIQISQNIEALEKISKLDGCYVLKTDIQKDAVTKETIHDRYKDLKHVEWAFRESKSMHLEMRPIHVRLESRTRGTRGHALVVMLAYL